MFGQAPSASLTSSAGGNSIAITTADMQEGIIDMDLIRTVARTEASHVRRTLAQLKCDIVNRNNRFHFTQTELNRACYDMNRQGVDIEKLERELQVRRYEYKRQEEIKRDVEDCYFYIPNMTVARMPEFRNKVFEYNMIADLQECLGRRDLTRDVRNKILGRTLGVTTVPDIVSARPAPLASKHNVSMSTRNETSQRKFVKLIGEYVARGCSMNGGQLARLIYNATNENPIWAALVQQLDGVNLEAAHSVREEEFVRSLIDRSVSMIENQNYHNLPTEIFAVESYVKNILLMDPDMKKCQVYYDPRTNRPVWAMAYELLKAGRSQDILKLGHEVNQGSFLDDLQTYLNSNGNTRIIWRGDNIYSDVFLETIYNVFNKDPMVQQFVVKTNSDLLWFILKVIDVRSDAEKEFSLEELRKLMAERDNQEKSTSSLLNLLLSTNYDDLLDRVNQRISYDDYVHMLIVLDAAGFRRRGLVNKSTTDYQELLLAYAMDAVNTGLENGLNYVLLAYRSDQQEESKEAVFGMIERLLLQRNLVEEFFGGNFPRADSKYIMHVNRVIPNTEKQYASLVSRLAAAYKQRQKFVYPALLYEELLKNHTASMNCLIEMRLALLLEERNIEEAEKKNAIDLIVRLAREPKQKEQALLLAFLDSYESLTNALNNGRVAEELQQNLFIPKSPRIDFDTQQVLSSLVNRNALPLYLNFFEKVLKAVEVDCVMKADQYAHQMRWNVLESFFRKLREHALVATTINTLRPSLNKINMLLNMPNL